MTLNAIFYFFYILVGVFFLLIINAAIIIIYYTSSDVDSKTEILYDLLFMRKKDASLQASDYRTDLSLSIQAKSFRKYMWLMTRVLHSLMIVFVSLFFSHL